MNNNYFPVADLKNRYGLGKQAEINRRKHLKIEPKKIDRSYFITKDQLDLLDQLDQFLKSNSNAKMEDFVPNTEYTSTHEVIDITTMDASIESKPNPIVETPELHEGMVQLTIPGFEDMEEFVLEKCLPTLKTLVESIVSSNKNEVRELKQLQEVSEQGWWLTTLQVKNLTGATPKLKKGETQWQRGCFVFSKVGKIGNQIGWKVSRSG